MRQPRSRRDIKYYAAAPAADKNNYRVATEVETVTTGAHKAFNKTYLHSIIFIIECM